MDEDWSDDLSEMVEDWDQADFAPMEARRGGGRGGKSTRLITLFTGGCSTTASG